MAHFSLNRSRYSRICQDYYHWPENNFRSGNIGSPGATRKTMQVVNSDADLLSRHAPQMASRFHHTTKILLTASPVWTQMTTAVDRAAVGHVVASTHGRLCHRI